MAKKSIYKFTDKRHAKGGLISTVLACISLLIFVVLIYVSFLHGGNGGIYIGSIGLTGLITSVMGLVFGIMGFKEEDTYSLFSKIGSICNMVIILVWVCIYLVGI